VDKRCEFEVPCIPMEGETLPPPIRMEFERRLVPAAQFVEFEPTAFDIGAVVVVGRVCPTPIPDIIPPPLPPKNG